MDWSGGWRDAFRIELRAEAIGLAWRKWPVFPGSYLDGGQWVGGDAAAEHSGPVPVEPDWADHLLVDANRAASWWSVRPYSLLLATGYVVDAVEVDAPFGRRIASTLRRRHAQPVPIVATPDNTWLFLVAAGSTTPSRILAQPGVVLHGRGSWITLPPTPAEHGVVHWRVKPSVCGWKLPSVTLVEEAVAAAVRAEAQELRARGERLLTVRR
ncbi:DNA primase [Actinoalloteichus sp. AHMU CJ021]|uniref:DNA primase/polymerase bifunctional N-terminal domain-containing protein n=1 Tax=Actinoalloteichus caeruleus DSM 43889 TaxID=1120930 RepID=A0ABT1JJK3_ACTCY|nr:bifunctional DNA primase/polymerase [Actinoalloteichus caeruleus]AUS78582.1 DNA primase [Actinoalloteichus sp. AHMU CJ021]MCP2332706.1 hypothetical protein [Actinoalloteichus caeruleus DSM 43889]